MRLPERVAVRATSLTRALILILWHNPAMTAAKSSTESAASTAENRGETLDFEQVLERLEQIVNALEEGQIGLGEAMARYEEGVKLLRQAYGLLEGAERKIQLLTGVDAQGHPLTRPLDDAPTLEKP